MAKAATKQSTKVASKEPRKASSRPSASKVSAEDRIEKVSEESLQKLRDLNIEQNLQNDIEWCLGSYRADRNPVGLYEVSERVLAVFRSEKEKKTKGVTAKLITDVEKALQSR